MCVVVVVVGDVLINWGGIVWCGIWLICGFGWFCGVIVVVCLVGFGNYGVV